MAGSRPVKQISIRLLGECRITYGDRLLTGIPFGFFRITTFLLLEGNDQSALRWRLARLFWSEASNEGANADLRQAIARIRRFQELNGFHLILADSTRISLAPDRNVVCDLALLLGLLKSADPAAAIEACKLYDGRLLEWPGTAGNEFEEWLTFQREDLRGRFIDFISRAISAQTQLTSEDRAFCARHLLTVDPYQENAYRTLMLAAAENGQISSVHQLYGECRRKLGQDLGIAPTQATIELFEQLVSRAGPEPNTPPDPPSPWRKLGRQG